MYIFNVYDKVFYTNNNPGYPGYKVWDSDAYTQSAWHLDWQSHETNTSCSVASTATLKTNGGNTSFSNIVTGYCVHATGNSGVCPPECVPTEHFPVYSIHTDLM